MKQIVNNFILMSTGRWAVSLISISSCLPFILFFSLELETNLDIQSFSTQLMAASSGVMVALLFLFLCQSTFLSNRREEKQNFVTCLVIWFATGAIQGLVTDGYAYSVLKENSHTLNRVASSSLTTGLILGLTAYWFGIIDKIRTENIALRRLDDFLTIDRSQINSVQIESQDLTKSHLQHALLPKVTQIKELASELKDSAPSSASTKSLAEIENQAGILYADLDARLQQLNESDWEFEPNRVVQTRRIEFMTGIFPKEISVATSFLFLFCGAIISQSTRNGLKGALAGSISALLILFTLVSLRAVQSKLGLLQKTWFIPVTYSIIFLVQYTYGALVQGLLIELPNPYPALYSTLKTLSGVYLASLLTTLFNIQTKHYSTLTDENIRLRSNLKRLDESADQVHQLSTSALVGEVNGKISGAVMALNMLKTNTLIGSMSHDIGEFLQDTKKLVVGALEEVQKIPLRERSR